MKYFTYNDKEGFIEKELDQLFNSLNKLENFNDVSNFSSPIQKLETFEDLMDRDNQREKDGFEKKIKIKKLAKDDGGQVIVVPFTYEEKLIHDSFQPTGDGGTGGQGEGEEGEKTGEKDVDDNGEGEGQEPGEPGTGSGGEHGISKDTYELGKELSEKLKLPNLQDKGKKVPIPEWDYDLTDKSTRFGQFLDKKETIKKVLKSNLLLGTIDPKNIDTSDIVIGPRDKVYSTLAREKKYQSQAVVFFVRDYSGSMFGDPTKIVCDIHTMLYTCLIYQYSRQVIPRFILHDTEAKEVNTFDEYYRSTVNGGTYVSSAYKLVNEIIEDESLDRNYNIYLFQGTDGDDWGEDSEEAPNQLSKLMHYCNRIGITVARSRGDRNRKTSLENFIEDSGLLKNMEILRMLALMDGDRETLEETVKILLSEDLYEID